MGSIDEVSAKLGEFEAKTDAIKDHIERIDEQAEAHRTTVIEKLDSINLTMTAHMAECKTTKDKVEELEPKVESHEKMKNRLVGYGTAAAGGVGGLAAYLKDFFHNT